MAALPRFHGSDDFDDMARLEDSVSLEFVEKLYSRGRHYKFVPI
jgi:hypothetical protein